MKCYVGIDVGSISVNLAVVDEHEKVTKILYLRSVGRPLEVVRSGLQNFLKGMSKNIAGVGVTGSGRNFIGHYVNADVIKDEITAHSQAVLKFYPEAKTIIEIGGQDSKLILIESGCVRDFSMNSVCAAGTGSFLDQQAVRLQMSVEEFSRLAAKAKKPTPVSGRCTVFAETDMIHKQQLGHEIDNIAAGLCRSLARNYLTTVAGGRVLRAPIVFQGGVAANKGMHRAFTELLDKEILVPKHFDCMGAIGIALVTKRIYKGKSRFRGISFVNKPVHRKLKFCSGCSNKCELADMYVCGKLVATIGSKCERFG